MGQKLTKVGIGVTSLFFSSDFFRERDNSSDTNGARLTFQKNRGQKGTRER